MDIKTTLDNSTSNYAKNLRDLSLQLNYDKGSNEAKVSINSFEFIKEEAEILLAKVNGEGLGVMFGVPYKIEIGEKGVYNTVLDGMVDLTKADKFSCREVIAPVIDIGGNDFLTQTADSFTYEFLFHRRADLFYDATGKLKANYVPYVKNSPANTELASAVFNLVSLIIQIETAIEALIGVVGELEAFSWEKIVRIIIQSIYIFFLLKAVIVLTQTILDMVLGPVKYHAAMSALDLCQIGAEYKGYTFASTILEGDYKNLVIIPPKNEVSYEETITNFNLITGFTLPDDEEQTPYYQGTFGQLLRDLIVMFNGKIIIEEPVTGGKKIIRLERNDYNTSQKLYTMPDVDFDGVFKLNTNEFNAASSLQYLTDSADINTFQFWSIANVLEVVEPVDIGGANEYLNLFKGYSTTTIPFSMAVRKDATRTRTEEAVLDILSILQPLLGELISLFNAKSLFLYNNLSWQLDAMSTIMTSFGFEALSVEILELEPIVIQVPDWSVYTENREGVMYLENDQLNNHRVAILDEGYYVSLTPDANAELEGNKFLNDLPFLDEELVNTLSNKVTTGEAYKNTLNEDNNTLVSAITLYRSFHQINSFYPSTERTKGNQWKIYEVSNVPFCREDWLLLKTDNKFTNAQGEDCLLESLEWNPFTNKADFKYRINTQYLTNIQLKNGTLLQSNGK